jgi:hypothetical protein
MTEKMMIHPERKDCFIQFSRNGRWGTCGDCPRDSNGKAYPEFCKYTKRYDHHLTVDDLAHTHKAYLGEL